MKPWIAILAVLCATSCTSSKQDPDCSIRGCPGWFTIRNGKIIAPPAVLEPQRALVLTPFGDGKYWLVREQFTWPSKFGFETVPQGFVTDLASIPRPLWALLPKWEGYGPPAIVHDYLYYSQHTTRYVADQWLLIAMDDMGVGKVKRYTIYAALRLFGGPAWKSNARRREQKLYGCLDQDMASLLIMTNTWEELQPFAVPCKTNSQPTRISPLPPDRQ